MKEKSKIDSIISNIALTLLLASSIMVIICVITLLHTDNPEYLIYGILFMPLFGISFLFYEKSKSS